MCARTSMSTFTSEAVPFPIFCCCLCMSMSMCVPRPAAGPEAPAPAELCVSGCPGTPPASGTSQHTTSGSPSSKLQSPSLLTKTHTHTYTQTRWYSSSSFTLLKGYLNSLYAFMCVYMYWPFPAPQWRSGPKPVLPQSSMLSGPPLCCPASAQHPPQLHTHKFYFLHQWHSVPGTLALTTIKIKATVCSRYNNTI